MAAVTDTKAYVTSMYSDSVAIIDFLTNTVSGYINIHKSSEAVAVMGNKAYISSWIGGNKLMVINTITDEVLDSIIVGQEPESMAIDNSYRLWVLCTGGWQKLNPAELYCIDGLTARVSKKLVFAPEASPSCLRIDGLGKTLYYIDRGVRKMETSSGVLPGTALILESGVFYKIGINPVNSDIFVSNAGDYVHNGSVEIYKNDGTPVSKQQAGIIPGTVDFNIFIN
jgi:YVTN family beta-propeller protein